MKVICLLMPNGCNFSTLLRFVINNRVKRQRRTLRSVPRNVPHNVPLNMPRSVSLSFYSSLVLFLSRSMPFSLPRTSLSASYPLHTARLEKASAVCGTVEQISVR